MMNIFLLLLLLLLPVLSGQQSQLCPDIRLIQPCQCKSDNNAVSISCAQLQSVDQLRNIFEPAFPTHQLWHLSVKHSVLGDLEANLLSDKSFAVILFQNVSGIERILPHAFAASAERLRVLSFDSSPLGQLSVAGLADLENLVNFEVTSSVDYLIDFQSLPNLQYLHLYGNRFTSPPALPHLPKLHSLWLNSGRLKSIHPLDFSNFPSLRKIILFGNQLSQLKDEDLHFQSSRVDLIDLSDNDFSGGISAKAIQGIGFNTVIDMKRTNLSTLEENTWRPLLNLMIKGSGHIQFLGSLSLKCDCPNMGWLFRNPQLMAKISQNSKCSDGLHFSFKSTRLNCTEILQPTP